MNTATGTKHDDLSESERKESTSRRRGMKLVGVAAKQRSFRIDVADNMFKSARRSNAEEASETFESGVQRQVAAPVSDAPRHSSFGVFAAAATVGMLIGYLVGRKRS